ncbi:hypothetical protein JTB14_013089 [Gonioctena quinquepunctata]|nr:hypothetical protein JTB14_013089 [Gonioctena quinquepunctata]
MISDIFYERMEEMMEAKYKVKPPCPRTCKRRCPLQFSEERRMEINREYRSLSRQEKKIFVENHTTKEECKSRRPASLNIRNRNVTFNYFLVNDEGFESQVCKTFFMTTLGYKITGASSLPN